MKPIIRLSGGSSCPGSGGGGGTGSGGGGGLFTEVGLLLVEGRTPDPGSPRGHREGPHVPPSRPTQSGGGVEPPHECREESGSCERAAGLRKHLSLLSENYAPMTINVLLSPDCVCGAARSTAVNICCLASSQDLLIEQWTVSLLPPKSDVGGSGLVVTEKALLQAIRSQLHFSQLSAWYSLRKVEHVTYRLSHPVGCPVFSVPPLQHDFPLALLSSGSYIKVSLKSLPRLEVMPTVVCPLHDTVSPLATTVTVFKSVFAELGHCLLDPPARIPVVKQGFTMWRESKQPGSPSRSRHKSLKSPTKHRHLHVPGLVDDRLQSGCQHIGKHHCLADDSSEERVSPPTSQPHHTHNHGEGCSRFDKQPTSCDFDLNKSSNFGVFDILRTQVCNRVSIGDSSSSCAEAIFSGLLQKRNNLPGSGECCTLAGGGTPAELLTAGGSNSNNPLKRKRSGLETACKRLLAGEGKSSPASDAPADIAAAAAGLSLAESFNRLRITTSVTQAVKRQDVRREEAQFIKPTPITTCKQIPSPLLLRKQSAWLTDSSSEETECESPRAVSCTPSVGCLQLTSSSSSSHSSSAGLSRHRVSFPGWPPRPPPGLSRRPHHTSLLGSFEENILKGRLKPVSVVEGFSADLGAASSGHFTPRHLKLPVSVSYFSFEPHSAPYLGVIKLTKKGYRVPRSGTVQVSLFNPLGTVVKVFVVGYDLSDMPVSSLTLVRQRAVGPAARLNHLIHLRFCSSKSGRISLHSDIKMLISQQYDVDSSICLDMESQTQLNEEIGLSGEAVEEEWRALPPIKTSVAEATGALIG